MSRDLPRVRPFDAVRAALREAEPENGSIPGGREAGDVRADGLREVRTGIPEVVLAESKSLAQVVDGVTRLARATGRAMASRCPEAMLTQLPAALQDAGGLDCTVHADAAAIVAVDPGHAGSGLRLSGGKVGVITAGTSDIRVAAEAALMATEMGCAIIEVRDVGVAGLHRLVRPLETMIDAGIDALIVVAGMDGALPSVVAGLVDVPVIGVPSSVGYGFGGRGEAALMSMLQSCAPGLVVVNIDNGLGAGAAAARIANRLAAKVR